MLAAGAIAHGEQPSAAAGTSDVETPHVESLIRQLDDSRFSIRQQAEAQLKALAERETSNAALADRFRQALLAEETSFEVRVRLEALLRQMRSESPPQTNSLADLDAMLAELNHDQYVRRDRAVRQLSALLHEPKWIVPLWGKMKQRLADPQITASERRMLDPLVERAHEAWLRSDLPADGLPRPSDAQIDAWIDDVSRPELVEDTTILRRSPAERELLDLIARDDMRPFVLKQLQARIEQGELVDVQRLQALVDFAKPGMAAEAWSHHTNTTVQYLLIDVPQFNDAITPPKATHFDRIDDETAHCVTGNSLTEGDYPVRVAIPHPEPGRDHIFYLTNLPTPRRRLAFEYDLKRDEGTRLAEMTQRTLAYFLKRQAPLSEVEVLMLTQLDPKAVSRFAGEYFATVPNAPLVSSPNGLNQTTVYGGMCVMLSRMGTREAVPALEKLARSDVLGGAMKTNRVDLPWVAVLSIAARDPWPEIDTWLAGLIDETRLLTADPHHAPELGASAAGLLLDRHGALVHPFGLISAGETISEALQFYGFRFASDQSRQDVKRWWQKQQTLAAAKKSQRAEPQN